MLDPIVQAKHKYFETDRRRLWRRYKLTNKISDIGRQHSQWLGIIYDEFNANDHIATTICEASGDRKAATFGIRDLQCSRAQCRSNGVCR
jgi:hypothetical protein